MRLPALSMLLGAHRGKTDYKYETFARRGCRQLKRSYGFTGRNCVV